MRRPGDTTRIRSWLFDAGVAASVGYLAHVEPRSHGPTTVIGLLLAAALLARRHYPRTVMATVSLLALAHLPWQAAMRWSDIGVLIAMYAVVIYCPEPRWGVLAGLTAGVGVVLAAGINAREFDTSYWPTFWSTGAVTLAVWVTAYSVRTRRLYVATLEDRAAALERERDHLAQLTAADERAAIARELHDVVAHGLSVMIVQADGASYALDRSSPAHDALVTIASTGREALTDMRRLVRLLRGASAGQDGGTGWRRIGLAELDSLLAGTAAAGLRVALETVGTPTGLSPAEELTTYRIVQESLTNALRHAGPDAAVTLRLVYATEQVSIEVCDDGAGRRSTGPGSGGHGLVGMRERAALHGGQVEVGPRLGGGWRVAATIPRSGEDAR